MIFSDVQYSGRSRKAIEALLAESRRLDRAAARELAEAAREANRIDRLAGRGADGSPLRPVRRPRVGRYAGADGPPLAPHGQASRSITGFYATEQRSQNGFTLIMGNRSTLATVLRYHAEGRSGSGVPISRDGQVVGFRGIKGKTSGIRRDVLGLGPQAVASLREFLPRQAGRLREFLRSAYRRAGSLFS